MACDDDDDTCQHSQYYVSVSLSFQLESEEAYFLAQSPLEIEKRKREQLSTRSEAHNRQPDHLPNNECSKRSLLGFGFNCEMCAGSEPRTCKMVLLAN